MTHTCTKHSEGTPACYTRHACRCLPCRREANRAKKRYAAGLCALVDAAPAKAHIESLVGAGWTHAGIGRSAGLAVGHVRYIATTARRVNGHVASAVLAVKGPDAGLISAEGTARRLRALSAVGWSGRLLSRRLGMSEGYLYRLLYRERIDLASAQVVARLYDELWDQPGPSDLSRQRAAAKGWPPPMAWDDGYGPHGIDNPDATPIGMVTAGDLGTRGRTADIIIERIEMGYSMADLQSLGYRETAVERALIRADRYDMWSTIRPGDVGGTGRNQHTKAA